MPPKRKLRSTTAEEGDAYSTPTKKTPPPKKHNDKKGITIPEFEEGKYYIIQFKDGQNKILYQNEQYVCITEELHNDIVSITDCESLEEANETAATRVSVKETATESKENEITLTDKAQRLREKRLQLEKKPSIHFSAILKPGAQNVVIFTDIKTPEGIPAWHHNVSEWLFSHVNKSSSNML
jgi:hypothetical protein